MELIRFYIFKCRDGDEIRLKHYAGILVIEFWANLMHNMDTEEAAAGVTGTVNLIEWRQRWRGRPGRHVTIYIKYIRFYSFTPQHGAQIRH